MLDVNSVLLPLGVEDKRTPRGTFAWLALKPVP